MELTDLIFGLPVRLDEPDRVETACYIASVMGECDYVTRRQSGHWDVRWDDGVSAFGVWLSQQGVYVSDDVDEAKANSIVGYCALRDIPWFTDDTILRLEREHEDKTRSTSDAA